MNIILTAIGSMSALCAIEHLHKAGHLVIGCDIYPKEWHYEASLCDVFEQAPLATSETYVPFLLKLAEENNVKYIFPLTDLEIDKLNKYRTIFEEKEICLCMPSEDTLAIARDKYALHCKFKDDDMVMSVPTYTSGGDLSDLSYPCIAKPRGGRSSEGLVYVQNAEQLKNYLNDTSYIFQEIIKGNVCTIDYVRNSHDHTSFCVPREELLRTKNGAGTTVRVFHDASLEALVEHIGETLNINGAVNMEFICQDGFYYLIDINPRFSAGIAFSCRTGYDFVNAHLACFCGEAIPNKIKFNERLDVKYFTESNI